MEHSLHIAVKHFVEAIAPTSPKSLCKKVNQDFASIDDDDNAPLDPDLDSESEDFTSGDSLGKALALVKQLCSSIHSIYCRFRQLTNKTDSKIPSSL